MSDLALDFLPNHEPFPEPAAGQRRVAFLLTAALCAAAYLGLGPLELVASCWAGLAGWGWLQVRQHRSGRDTAVRPTNLRRALTSSRTRYDFQPYSFQEVSPER